MIKRWPVLAALLFVGCSNLPNAERRIEIAHAEAAAQGFVAERITAGTFELQTFHKGLGGGSRHWQVYLEGDGLAFLSPTRLSSDPTPVDPVGLRLALADPAPAVLYLGRPCQYRPVDDIDPCPNRYWSSHRFAEEVVSSTLNAIETLFVEHGKSSVGVTLIGFSGGGALAALIASRSPRVSRLITVAAPLDLSAWTAHHGVSSLDGSLDPMFVASQLTMPQTHLRGGLDEIVPPILQSAFLRTLPQNAPVRAMTLDNVDHTCCWQDRWPSLLGTVSAMDGIRG